MRFAVALVLLLAAAGFLQRGIPVANASISATEVTELTLERGPCFGTCPIYRIVLRSDGTATYVGWNYVERIGVYSGTFAPEEFSRLVEAVETLGFWQLQESYLQPVEDLPVVRTAAVRADITRKIVQDHGAVGVPALEGPAELLRIQAAIDSVAAEIGWERVSESPDGYTPGLLSLAGILRSRGPVQHSSCRWQPSLLQPRGRDGVCR